MAYIEKEKLLQTIREQACMIHDPYLYKTAEVNHIITDFEEVDVIPLRHGKWIDRHDRGGISLWTECSECGFPVNRFAKTKWCAECGAKMDKKK